MYTHAHTHRHVGKFVLYFILLPLIALPNNVVLISSQMHIHLIIHHFIVSNFAKLERKRDTRTHISYEYEYLKKEEHRFYRYINVVFQMITICSGILICCCLFLYIFFVCRLFGKLFVRFCMCFVCFIFISNFKRCARHKTQTQTESEKTNQKSTRFLSIFCDCRLRLRAALSAFRYTYFVASASNACRWQTERR